MSHAKKRELLDLRSYLTKAVVFCFCPELLPDTEVSLFVGALEMVVTRSSTQCSAAARDNDDHPGRRPGLIADSDLLQLRYASRLQTAVQHQLCIHRMTRIITYSLV